MNEDEPLLRMWNVPPSIGEAIKQARQQLELRLERVQAEGIVVMTNRQFFVADYLYQHAQDLHTVRGLSVGTGYPPRPLQDFLFYLEGMEVLELEKETSGTEFQYRVRDPEKLLRGLKRHAEHIAKGAEALGEDYYEAAGIDKIRLQPYLEDTQS